MKNDQIEIALNKIAKALFDASKVIDSAVETVRHDESFRNHPECRRVESEIMQVLSLTDSSNRLNKVWRKIDKLK